MPQRFAGTDDAAQVIGFGLLGHQQGHLQGGEGAAGHPERTVPTDALARVLANRHQGRVKAIKNFVVGEGRRHRKSLPAARKGEN